MTSIGTETNAKPFSPACVDVLSLHSSASRDGDRPHSPC